MLYKIQEDLINNSNNRYCFRSGTSTGKTLIGLHHYLKYGDNKKLIIIAPSAKVKEQGWNREIAKVEKQYNIKIDYEIYSYGVIHKQKLSNEYHYIIDEAHYIKNSTSKRGKAIANILKNKNVSFTLLTATPFSKWEEFINYAIIYGIVKNKTEFYKNYCIMESIPTNNRYGYFMKIKDYQNTNDLLNLVQSNFSRKVTVDDIVELPGQIQKYIHFTPSSEYKKVNKTKIYDGEPLDTLIKFSTTLRQITNTKDKLEYLKMLYENIKDSDDNLLIFYNFKSEKNEILNSLKVDYVIDGQNKKYPDFEEFQNQKGKVTLVQIQAGGTGIELQYNNLVVFYSPTYSYQNYIQALGRTYRIGQVKKVIIYQFLTDKTIEEKIYQALDKKKDFDEKEWGLDYGYSQGQ